MRMKGSIIAAAVSASPFRIWNETGTDKQMRLINKYAYGTHAHRNTTNTHTHTGAHTRGIPFPEIEAMDGRLSDEAGWRPDGGTEVRGRGVAQGLGRIGPDWIELDWYGLAWIDG